MSNSVLNFTSLLSLGPENGSFAKMAGDLLEDIGLFVPTKDLQFTSKFNLHDIFKHWWLFYSWFQVSKTNHIFFHSFRKESHNRITHIFSPIL